MKGGHSLATETEQETYAQIGPSRGEMARRLVLIPFALIQGSIALRIVLLLLNARQDNTLVRVIMEFSGIFVGPFVGILHANSLRFSGSILDLSAIVALIGWTIFETIVMALLALFPDSR